MNEKKIKPNTKVGIIGAMDDEVSLLKKAARIDKTTSIASMEFCEGEIDGRSVVIVKCGMGKVNAGICVSTLIREFHCDVIINTGVAGSLDARMDIGDIVISLDAVQHDFDVTPIGFQKAEIPYTGLYAFKADEMLREAAKKAADKVIDDVKIFEGRVCSGDQFIASKGQKDTIVSNFGGLACEMEGASVAQTCYLFNVPFVILRAISDKPDGTGASDFAVFTAQSAARCSKIILEMLKAL